MPYYLPRGRKTLTVRGQTYHTTSLSKRKLRERGMCHMEAFSYSGRRVTLTKRRRPRAAPGFMHF